MDDNSLDTVRGADGRFITMLYQGIHSGEGLEVKEGSHFPSDLLG